MTFYPKLRPEIETEVQLKNCHTIPSVKSVKNFDNTDFRQVIPLSVCEWSAQFEHLKFYDFWKSFKSFISFPHKNITCTFLAKDLDKYHTMYKYPMYKNIIYYNILHT